MLISVIREYGLKSTISRVLVNGKQFCYGLELPNGECIPEGEYSLMLTYSPRFRRIMPLIANVPFAEGIRIHVGNFPKDTQKCLLVAYDKGEDCILRSRVCFEELLRWLTEANKDQVLAIEFKS